MGDGPDDLENYAPDTTVSAGLHAWAGHQGGTWHRPRRARHLKGYTPAYLFTIILRLPDGPGRHHDQKLLVKVLPPDAAARREPGRHALARQSSPGFAERHLVTQPYLPYPLDDRRHLMFQEVAGGADDMVTLLGLDEEEVVLVLRTVCDRVLNDWNGGKHRTATTTVTAYVRRELAALGALDDIHDAVRDLGLPAVGAQWLALGDGRPDLPHPLRAIDAHTPFETSELDCLCGNSHGDLHGGNVLVRRDAGRRLLPGTFRMVDLNTFEDNAPLTRDLSTLILTTVLRHVEGLPHEQADALASHLVSPTDKRPRWLPPALADIVDAGHQVGEAFAQGWGTEWRAQYLLSLMCQALTCCTYDDVAHTARRWCLALAARAWQAYLDEFPTQGQPTGAASPEKTGRDGSTPVAVRENDHRSWQDSSAQPHRRGPLGRPRLDLSRPAPQATFSVAAPTAKGTAGWHSAGPAPAPRLEPDLVPPLNPDGARDGSVFHPRSFDENPFGPPARPPASGAGLFRVRSAPRQLVVHHGRPVPRARPAPPGETVPTGPAGATARTPMWMKVLLTLAAVGGMFTPTVIPHVPSFLGRRESPTPPPTNDDRSSGSGDTTGAAARRSLTDLAQSVARLAEPRVEGPYTFVCSRVWSPEILVPGADELRTYRDERLWWNAGLAGRRTVNQVTDGRREPDPTVVRYGEGDLSEVPPRPSADLADLRDQFAQWLRDLPPEQRNAAGTLQFVAMLNRYHLLDTAQRAALLHHLADTPGIERRGSYPDRADRPGLAFSADDRQGRRETLLFDPGSGELLSHETTRVFDDAVLGYQLFLARARTDTVSGPGCG